MQQTLTSITLYPVKGLGGSAVKFADLVPDAGLAHDRRFGLCHASSNDLASCLGSSWKPWELCFTLQSSASLARLVIDSYSSENSVLALDCDGFKWQGSLAQNEGRASLSAYLKDRLDIVCEVADSSNMPLWDWGKQAAVTILNAASIAAVCAKLEMPADPRRFRGNLLFAGGEAWAERNWVPGSRIRVGAVEFEVIRAMTRCAATKVNPDTAQIDAGIPAALFKNYGHTECGLGLVVKRGGRVGIGDAVEAVFIPPRKGEASQTSRKSA